MFKLLAIAIALIFCGLAAEITPAQTANNYSDDSKIARPVDRVVSSEARAESKRLYKEGIKYGLAGLLPQAIEILERAVRLDPANADAHYALGHAYFDAKQWEKAVDSFERVVELNPKDQEARDRLSLARTMAHGGSAAKPTVSRPNDSSSSETTGVQVSMTVKSAPPPPLKTEPVKEEANAAANELTASELALTKVYRVGPGDVLDIHLNDSASPQSTLFTVTASGFVEHPMLGEPLQAGGLTVDEISSKFESELKRRALIDNPKVSVGVRDYASHTILVSGLVKDSGTKILRREAIPLYVVVADAQPLPEAARVTVVRNESNQTFDIDLAQSQDMNLLVRPGDVITLLPNVTQFVYIGGEVKLPGEKTYRRGLTLTQAILSAGGITSKGKQARLGRDDGNGFLVISRFKLKDIESGKVPDPVVKPGDRIMIVE
ncbi:MAG TPA: polysaccharide biosynthesis/export family protein [Pyrinomonadaceae bacterium]|nr:polysaccharide biosynthesis/export family protein [Pyrinomonadaceae bacterium]